LVAGTGGLGAAGSATTGPRHPIGPVLPGWSQSPDPDNGGREAAHDGRVRCEMKSDMLRRATM
jgi:hypothetical protein